MSKPYTHVLEIYPEATDGRGNKRPSMCLLHRADNGMTIGARQGQVVSMGEDPSKAVNRTYRDEAYATAALRRYADEVRRAEDPTSAGAVIEEVDMSHTIIQPNLGDITSISNGKRKQ